MFEKGKVVRRPIDSGIGNNNSEIFSIIFRTVLLFLLAFSFCFGENPEDDKRVLVISAYGPGFPTFFRQVEGLKSVFKPAGIKWDLEFMDSKRFRDDRNKALFYQYLRYKLSKLPAYDGLLVCDDNAFDFAVQHRDTLFPDIPIVFCGINNKEKISKYHEDPLISGVIEHISIKSTLDVITKLEKNVNHIYVISDQTTTGRADLAEFNQQKKFFPEVEFTNLSMSELSYDELMEQLSRIENNAVLFLLSAYGDKKGNSKDFYDKLASIRHHTDAPVFHVYAHGIGEGVVGGKVVCHVCQAAEAARIMINKFTKPADQQKFIVAESPNVYMFDYNLLQKYGYDPALLPGETIFINQPVSIFAKYKYYFVSTLFFIGILLLFIILLIREIRKKEQTEAKLQQINKEYETLVNYQKDMVVKVDAENKFEFVSKSYCDLFGKSKSDLIGHQFTPLVHEEDLAKTMEEMKKLKQPPNQCYIEQRAKTKYGWRWLAWSDQAILDKQGNILSIIGTGRDITERKKMELALSESQAKFKSAFQYSNIGIVLGDPDGNIIDVNPEFLEMLKYSKEELLTLNFQKITHHQDIERELRLYRQVLAGEQNSYRLEKRYISKEGEEVWVDISVAARKNKQDTIDLLIGMTIDISQKKKFEIALRESEEKFKSIFKFSHVGIVICEPRGIILEANQSFADMLGYKQYEIVSQKVSKYTHPDDRKRELEQIQMIFQNKKDNFNLEKRYITKNGEYFWADIFIAAQRDAKGALVRLIGVILNIDEKKKATESFLESQKKFVTLLENMQLIAINLDKNGNITFCNDFLLNLTGWEREEVTGKNWFEYFIPDDHKENMEKEAFIDVLRSGKAPTYYENPIKTRNGDQYDILWNNTVFYDSKGNFESITSIGQDITDKNRYLRKIQESEQRFKSYMENAPVGILVVNDQKQFLDANKAAEKMLQYSRGELKTKRIEDIIVKDDLEKNYRHFQEVCKKGQSSGEIRHITKSGENRVLAIDAVKLSDKRILAFAIDVTEKRASEAEQKKLEENMERSQRLETLGTLAGGIAHDFNNLLTPILGYSDMMKINLSSEDPNYDNINEIHHAALHAKELVSQMLNFSRKTEQHKKTVYVNVILKEVLKMLRPIIPSTIKIRHHIQDRVGKSMADATKIHQVFVNIINNAHQAIKDDKGELNIDLKQITISKERSREFLELSPGEYIEVAISDTGTGMDEFTKERIFDPFFTTKEIGSGTGLGLSVVHGIIRDHRGEITVQSKPEEGSTFFVYIPVIEEKKTEKFVAQKIIKGNQEVILLVDDKPNVTKIMSKLLETLGYQVLAVNSSREAYEIFQSNRDAIDLMVTDLTMPEMTGLTLAKKTHLLNPKLPVIMMTGYGNKISIEEQEVAGIYAIITKPITINEISNLLDEIFST